MRSTSQSQAPEWLAAAATDPEACKREWAHGENGTVLLPAGRFWGVLSVPEELGLLALDTLLRIPLPRPGPTLADLASHRLGFFLPPDPVTAWLGRGIRYVGEGAWIAVPPPHRATGTLRWLVPPDGNGALHLPTALELALHEAVGTLAVLVDGTHPPTRGRATPPEPSRGGLR
ncbi:bifunctional DNA primase/polymerase [Streptomyces sp. NPDC052236]|uniref:bifunctional DNA primase/polymerase n=1 Tax=Streptomyces sp. NPDC052236 TaxID=3365686 RepID=UPI0037D36D1E